MLPLAGAGLRTDGGVVRCSQLRTIDTEARQAALIETASGDLIADVLARVARLIE